jgi:hypothetical protein
MPELPDSIYSLSVNLALPASIVKSSSSTSTNLFSASSFNCSSYSFSLLSRYIFCSSNLVSCLFSIYSKLPSIIYATVFPDMPSLIFVIIIAKYFRISKHHHQTKTHHSYSKYDPRVSI